MEVASPAASPAIIEVGTDDAELSGLGGAVVLVTVLCPTGLPDPRLTVEVTQTHENGTAVANGLTEDLISDGSRHTVPVWVLGFDEALDAGEALVVARLIVGTTAVDSATVASGQARLTLLRSSDP